LTQAEYDRLREKAIESVVLGRGYSEEDADLLRGGPEALDSDFTASGNIVVQELINNTDVDDFLKSPALHFHDANTVADGFIFLHDGTDVLQNHTGVTADEGPLAGSLQTFDDNRTS
jgi:hypothetical protein